MKVFFGASGFAREIYWIYIRQQTAKSKRGDDIDYFVIADEESITNPYIWGIPLIHESEFFKRFATIKLEIYIAVGSSLIRKKIVKKILDWNNNVQFPALVDPSVIKDGREQAVMVGQGAIILPGVTLTTEIKIQDFTHVHIGCTVGHEARIGPFATISPGCHISGNVCIGENVFCGTGAVILERVAVNDHAVIGAGAVVTKTITDVGTYVGIPAKKIK